jgi:toxin ParE1/3/4
MPNYKISEVAKEDLIRIHQYGVEQFGMKHADKYFNAFFNYFENISKNPNSFESVDYIRRGYRRYPIGSDTIYFKVNKNNIEIMAIVGSQDLESKL